MELNDNELVNDKEAQSPANGNKKPTASRVDDDKNIEQSDLERSFIYAEDKDKPVTEGQPAGGHKFGENSLTTGGDDKNNPSQNAGYTNEYFRRTEPSEEHPEDTNFKVPAQNGSPDYDSAQPQSAATNEEPKPEEIQRGNGENDRPHKGNTYQEGTADNDGSDESDVNIPGPGELPDQQKVGEGTGDDKDHIET